MHINSRNSVVLAGLSAFLVLIFANMPYGKNCATSAGQLFDNFAGAYRHNGIYKNIRRQLWRRRCFRWKTHQGKSGKECNSCVNLDYVKRTYLHERCRCKLIAYTLISNSNFFVRLRIYPACGCPASQIHLRCLLGLATWTLHS